MSGSNSRLSPPANALLTYPNGYPTQAWANHWQAIAAAADAQVGDYRQTALADAGPNWLLCDGRQVSDAQFPNLSAVLKPLTGAGAVAGTFLLPGIAAVVVNGITISATWIKAF